MSEAFICDAVRTPIRALADRNPGDRHAARSQGAMGLHLTGGRHALVFMCIGVGQGIAMLLERV